MEYADMGDLSQAIKAQLEIKDENGE